MLKQDVAPCAVRTCHGDIFATVGRYEVTENEEEEIQEGDILLFCVRVKGYRILQKQLCILVLRIYRLIVESAMKVLL